MSLLEVFLDEFPAPDPTFADDPGPGIPGFFVAFFVLAVVLAIGTTIWKVTAARDMARRAGMDPGEATAMTVLSEDGLAATYLASNLRGPAEPDKMPAPTRRAAERLTELGSLRDTGAITETEYAERRKAIIDSV